MAFFNAQFIIIIGIIIIIYFLYKEINLLHKKINRLELDILNNNLISNTIPKNTIPSNTIPSNKKIIYLETNNILSSSEHIEIYSNDDETSSSIIVEEITMNEITNNIMVNEETVNEETVNNETINEEIVNNEKVNEEIVNNETVNEEIITINNYDKMKVNDLKKIAKDNNINLYKNDGKLKNKKELIENILNLKNI